MISFKNNDSELFFTPQHLVLFNFVIS